MPVNLPAPVINLLGLLRPRLLRPDLKAATIGHVDWKGLRGEGFNAVVIDKDNCITLPHADNLYPPYTPAWRTLLSAFPPGRVLVVSNSSGSAKDRGGIGAEALTLALGTPVLNHAAPKPACSADIVAYFAGRLGKPRTTRSELLRPLRRVQRAEDEAEGVLLGKWRDEVENGPLCGGERDPISPPRPEKLPPPEEEPAPTAPPATPSPLRLLVVGDRLFTDTLLARRLDKYLPAPGSVLSIQTTDLPQPNDVRPLRALEERLTRGATTPFGEQYSRFVRVDPPLPVVPPPTLAERLNPMQLLEDGGPPITWHPRSWRCRPVTAVLLRTLGRGLRVATLSVGIVAVQLARGLRAASLWAQARCTKWNAQRRAAAQAQAEAEAEAKAAEEAAPSDSAAADKVKTA
ncbi:Phosphatidylglycerophosphatase GEP4, mitochondrial [Vanrija pseudolonga]|uniref:Phosphatidylglycerophosphatase GEP4, mitochondrial n=1 Tax=Vanrija pseudolonga TaxID=143232 RepID=A0AAF0Y7U0_9TREE|nr:Phosphatidylglycerophosphatase GEP4, mitochondrial [Vanrija pseudolonga]